VNLLLQVFINHLLLYTIIHVCVEVASYAQGTKAAHDLAQLRHGHTMIAQQNIQYSDFPPLIEPVGASNVGASGSTTAGGGLFFPQAGRKRPLSASAQAATLQRPVAIRAGESLSALSPYPIPIDPKKVRVGSASTTSRSEIGFYPNYYILIFIILFCKFDDSIGILVS
jgi:hypothetical protein